MVADARICRGLGKIIVEFQKMEMMIVFLTHVLIDEDAVVGWIITSQLSFHKICDVCVALFRHRVDSQELGDELEAIIKRAASAEQQRNTFVHSAWVTKATNDGTKPVGRIKTKIKKRQFAIDSEEIIPEKLDDLSKSMGRIAYDIAMFMRKLRESGILDYPYGVLDRKTEA
jgi:hypothetical protein